MIGMKYIIEEDVKEFIKRLPDLTLTPPTVHLIMAAIRSKKVKEFLGIKVHDLVIERKIIRPLEFWRDRYFNSVYNLALLQHEGFYDLKDNKKVPSETVGLLATLSPRNVRFAVQDLIKDDIGFFYNNNEASNAELAKQSSQWFSKLHQHRAKGSHFVTIDIDSLDKELYTRVCDFISTIKIWMITETSGGYHIILDLTKEDDARTFYGQNGILQQLRQKEDPTIVEIQRDSQEPIPGTFYHRLNSIEPHFVKILR